MTLEMKELQADCKGSPPEIECMCCNVCCDASGNNCGDVAQQPTMAPISADAMIRFAEVTTVLNSVPVSDPATFQDNTTPQYEAAWWLAAVDPAMLDFATTPMEDVVERYILALLYYATNGENWKDQEGFLSAEQVCFWGSVGCRGDPLRVSRIELEKNDLMGSLPTELGLLSEITQLSFDDNMLTGVVPTEIFGFPNMIEFNLKANSFVGGIPTEVGSMTLLQKLELHQNEFTGPIPSEISNLSALEFMDLSQNQLNGPIPEQIGNLSNLLAMVLKQTGLSGQIPAGIGALVSLEDLNLESNAFTGSLPIQMTGLSELKDLLLSK